MFPFLFKMLFLVVRNHLLHVNGTYLYEDLGISLIPDFFIWGGVGESAVC